jgi:hypothetical protein
VRRYRSPPLAFAWSARLPEAIFGGVKKMIRRNLLNLSFVVFAVATAFPQIIVAQLANYNQDFEGLDISSPTALGDDGWLVGANVFDPLGNFIYNYFAFPAPNTGAAFSQIATGSGGPNQGLQYLNVFSDYNNGDHGNGLTIDAYVFRDNIISATDAGKTFEFEFDFRRADDPFGPANSMTTAAYLRVLDPFNNFSIVFDQQLNTTNATFDWSEGNTLSVTIDAGWNQFFLQYGFNNRGTNFDASGIYYDNVGFGEAADCILGDLNGDMMVTLLDVAGFVMAITTGTFSCEADTNQDGIVSLLDVSPFVILLTGG